MKRDIEFASLQTSTFELLNNIMHRFVDFYIAYLFYVLICLFGGLATIFELSDHMNNPSLKLWSIYTLACDPARFYLLLCSLYIFQPYWYLLLTKVEKNPESLDMQTLKNINRRGQTPVKSHSHPSCHNSSGHMASGCVATSKTFSHDHSKLFFCSAGAV
eukprot:Pgem_evm1s2414